MQRTRIAIIEDDALLVSLLTDWIRQRPHWTLVGHARDGEEGLRLCRTEQPDLALVDVSMSLMDGLALARELQRDLPGTRVIMLTCHTDPYTIRQIQELEVDGFVSKTSSLDVLERAIKHVLGGGRYFDEVYLQSSLALRDPHAFHKILSPREIEVLTHVAHGHADAQIAKALGISPYTVSAHRRNIRLKLDAHNDRELTLYARKWGLVTKVPAVT